MKLSRPAAIFMKQLLCNWVYLGFLCLRGSVFGKCIFQIKCPVHLTSCDFEISYISFALFCFLINLFNWRLITLQYWGGFCHTLTWISHGCTCVPHPEPIPSLRVVPKHRLWVPCMHWTWTGDLFHIWWYTCFNAILSNHPTLAFSHRVQKSALYLYLCLFCCLAYRVIVTVFLNSIYMS